MIGLGTVVNVVAILVGSAIGVALGHRLPQRTRDVVTDGLGLVVLLVAALSAAAVLDGPVRVAVGSAGVLIVLGSVLIGGIVGSLLGIETRLERVGERLRARLGGSPPDVDIDGALSDPGSPVAARGPSDPRAPAPNGVRSDPATQGVRSDPASRASAAGAPSDVGANPDSPAPSAAPAPAQQSTFVEGFVTASLVFCVGPLAILGSLSDGLGLGIDQLALKSIMDGFASIAFAASLGWGVAASAIAVAVYQGSLTVVGWALGSVLSDAQVSMLTATGGLLLVGISLRLLRIRQVPVGDLTPALLIAPILTAVVAAVMG